MSDYTPTQEEMRTDYIMAYDERGGSQLLAGMAFDRAIAKVKADALREAAAALPRPVGLNCNAECHTADWSSLRVRADRIEGGDGQ